MSRSSWAVADPYARFNDSCAYRTGKATLFGAFMGAGTGSVMLAWYPDPYVYNEKNVRIPLIQNSRYILNGLRMPVAWSALGCGVFTLTECVVEQMRDPNKESTYMNAFWGGAAAGAVAGIMTKNIGTIVPCALGFGILMGLVEWNGPRFAVDQELYHRKLDGMQGLRREESDIVKKLKEKYPEGKNL